MTDERIAIEALGRCTFSPGTFDKRFAKSLAETPEDFWLSTKQRALLWTKVVRYRRQMPKIAVEAARAWLAVPETERAFQNAIEANLQDVAPRLVFADWLDEAGRISEATAQRWMGTTGILPHLTPCGNSYGPDGSRPMNFEWTLGMKAWEMFDSSGRKFRTPTLGYHHRSREMSDDIIDQPPPIPNELPAVWDLVIEDMTTRKGVGFARYGTHLQAFNGRDQLMDAYFEALDLSVYLRTSIYERDNPMTAVTTPESLANAARIKSGEAQEVPPTALPADVYLDKLESLLRENSKLRSLLGQSLAVCRSIRGMVANSNEVSDEWCSAAVEPLEAELKVALGGGK